MDDKNNDQPELELSEWLESLDDVVRNQGKDRAAFILRQLRMHALNRGVRLPFSANTPQINSILPEEQPAYPGDLDIEHRIRSLVRWNAMAMVVRANRVAEGIGGHISTYASTATLLEVGFNHFFRAPTENHAGDQVYFQGHSSPGIYARAFLEGRLSREKLDNFRRERAPGGGLSSYPHPRLMPDFWQFPTVSMGLASIMAIYQARFDRYLEDRGLKPANDEKVWAFLGDGETDEPESLGAITLAAREKLDNLIFVVNCNLQRLDGPVRGNGQIIQELEAAFRGAGWHVVKVVLGSDWDDLVADDRDGLLARRWTEALDGEVQKYAVESGDYIREHFWGRDPRLLEMVANRSDAELKRLNLGGHDPRKVFAAFDQAVRHQGGPVVVLARTIKGYGLGEAGEGKNITHQQKKLNEDELRDFRTRFGIPLSDEDVAMAPFYRPPDDSPELRYLRERRAALGGGLPTRTESTDGLSEPDPELFAEFYAGTEGREVSSTMAFVRLLGKLLEDPSVGKSIVPIVPDEARTFGMEAMFRKFGIYSHVGQLYDPVDSNNFLYYREATDGQILEEGITEAGAMSSFIAAGSAYSTYGVHTIPVFIFYSMFGFQRIGDLIWAAGDMKCRGLMVGATAGRTTLAGEGLQHQDGQSQHFAEAYPHIRAYDPAYAYEIATIVRHAIRRMYVECAAEMYYLTVENENYPMPAIADAAWPEEQVLDGIIRGMYLLRPPSASFDHEVQLLASGALLGEAIAAAEILATRFSVGAHVWSVTSYLELRRDGMECERHNRLNSSVGAEAQKPFITECLEPTQGPIVAVSDYVRSIPDGLAKWIPRRLAVLGTDGFGRSETREGLRDFFEVDRRHIAAAALHELAWSGAIDVGTAKDAIESLGLDTTRAAPWTF